MERLQPIFNAVQAFLLAMIRGRSDNDILDRDETGRGLMLVTAIMGFVLTLALSVSIGLGGLASSWQSSLTGSMTIELPPEDDDLTVRLLDWLAEREDVITARRLNDQDMAELLAPYLGPDSLGTLSDEEGTSAYNLPVPILIDVTLKPDTAIAPLAEAIRVKFPNVSVDDHQDFLGSLTRLANGLQAVALIVAGLAPLATALIIAVITRTALHAHRGTVHILHLVGATDHYIAAEFERHYMRIVALGGLIGLAMGIIGLMILTLIGPNLISTGSGLSDLGGGSSYWTAGQMGLVLVPVILALLSRFACRRAVLSELRTLL